MKFIHMADLHLDSPFVVLANNEKFAIKRRLEQRQAMKNIVEYIKENNIPLFFIAGDLYEQNYVTKSTIEYINDLFKTIPNTKIYIAPGNHDPYIKNSFYKTYNWSSNVHIFTSELEIIENEDIDIYGYGFDNFYMKNRYNEIKIKNPEKINILVTHGSLDASDSVQEQYNPIKSADLKNMGFDYIALGHIHKKSYNDFKGQNIAYPGSCVSLGFDELGERGILSGNIEKNNLELTFIPIKTDSFIEEEMEISEINSKEDLIQMLNEADLENDKYYKIVLVGKSNFKINEYEILGLIQNERIIKIKDKTKIQYDIDEMSKQTNLARLICKKHKEKYG